MRKFGPPSQMQMASLVSVCAQSFNLTEHVSTGCFVPWPWPTSNVVLMHSFATLPLRVRGNTRRRKNIEYTSAPPNSVPYTCTGIRAANTIGPRHTPSGPHVSAVSRLTINNPPHSHHTARPNLPHTTLQSIRNRVSSEFRKLGIDIGKIAALPGSEPPNADTVMVCR